MSGKDKTRPSRFLLFLSLCGLGLVAALLAANAWALPWAGGEQAFLDAVRTGSGQGSLPVRLSAGLSDGGSILWLARFPSVVLFLATLAGILFLGRPLFGARYAYLAAAVLAGTWVVPFLGKVANTDIWVFSLQTGAALALLRYLKRPERAWRLGFYLALGLALWVHPASTLLFALVLPSLLYGFHPQGKRLGRLQPWGAALAGVLVLYLAGALIWTPPGLFFGFRPGRYLLFTTAAFLPFLPFLVSGLWEAAVRFRKGEEFAVVLGSWCLAGLLGQSLVLHAGLAWLVARQMEVYFRRGYPYRNLVRTVAVLQLIGSFLAITVFLLLGFGQYGGAGFRAVMAPGAVYWMLSFLVVLGLFGMNARQVKGGMVLGGLATFLLFWLSAYPFWHGQRQWPLTVREYLEDLDHRPGDTVYVAGTDGLAGTLRWHLWEGGGADWNVLEGQAPLPLEADSRVVLVLDTLRQPPAAVVPDTVVAGLSDGLRPLQIGVVVGEGLRSKKEDAATGF